MSSSSKREVSSQKEEWKSSKCQLLPVKHCLLTWWDFWRRDDARNSFKPCKTSRRATQKPTQTLTLISLEEKCFRSTDYSKTRLILLATQLPFTQTIASCTDLPSNSFEKSSSIWIPWAKTLLPSSTQFMVWVASLKVFQGSALWMEEPSCSILTSMRFCLKTAK